MFKRLLGSLMGRPGEADPNAFADHMVAALQAALPEADVRLAEPLVLWVAMPGRPPTSIGLQPLFEKCRRDPAAGEAEIRHFVETVRSHVRSAAEPLAANDFRLVMRPANMIAESTSGDGLVAEHLVGDIWAVLGVHRQGALSLPSANVLNGIGLAKHEAMAMGLANMRGKAVDYLSRAAGDRNPGMEMLWGEGEEASMLLFAELWQGIAALKGGMFIVVAPSPHILIYGNGEEPGAQRKALDMAEQCLTQGARLLSLDVLEWRRDHWAPAAPILR